jgi:hypothetical protein
MGLSNRIRTKHCVPFSPETVLPEQFPKDQLDLIIPLLLLHKLPQSEPLVECESDFHKFLRGLFEVNGIQHMKGADLVQLMSSIQKHVLHNVQAILGERNQLIVRAAIENVKEVHVSPHLAEAAELVVWLVGWGVVVELSDTGQEEAEVIFETAREIDHFLRFVFRGLFVSRLFCNPTHTKTLDT